MTHAKKMIVALILGCFMVFGIAATRPDDEPAHKNLKVLPKNISKEDLDKVMDGFKAALGVKCNFCHAAFKDSTLHKLDFASDEKPEKNIARHMMRMSAKINKKFFSFNKDDKGDPVQTVTCVTCHRGNPNPGEK
jgi:Photosynthetic reaction centre cytochrome C subunit